MTFHLGDDDVCRKFLPETCYFGRAYRHQQSFRQPFDDFALWFGLTFLIALNFDVGAVPLLHVFENVVEGVRFREFSSGESRNP